MRTIKFKAKRIDNGEWVFGYYFFNGNQHGIIDSKSFPGNWSEIDPETVCQFTGLLDKNGVEIWEGDIVTVPWVSPVGSIHEEEKDREGPFTVGFERGTFMLKTTPVSCELFDWCRKEKGDYVPNYGNPTIYHDTTFLLVTRNIHDNPQTP